MTGNLQQVALDPHFRLVDEHVPRIGFVQKQGIPAGIANPSRSSHRQLRPFLHSPPLRVQEPPMPISFAVPGGQPGGTSGTRKVR